MHIINICKSPQVSRYFLSILVDLNDAAVWIVSIRPLIYKSFSPFPNPLVTVLRAPTTIGITVTFMPNNFFNPERGPGTYPSFLFLLILLSGQPGSVCISKSQKSYYNHYYCYFSKH